MLQKNDYSLNVKDLSIGLHSFEFRLGGYFFEAYEFGEEVSGDILSDVSINKQLSFTQICVRLNGEIFVSCDRCLEPMSLPVSREISATLKLGDSGQLLNEEEVDVLVADWVVDLPTLFYEEIALSIPTRKVHKDGECNEKMLQMLSSGILEKQELDPRWEALRNFSDNLKKN